MANYRGHNYRGQSKVKLTLTPTDILIGVKELEDEQMRQLMYMGEAGRVSG